MADFHPHLHGHGRTLAAWANLLADDALFHAIVVSLALAVLTVLTMLAILVPTMICGCGRPGPGTRRIPCLLPLTIPALVIVVGLRKPVGDLTCSASRPDADVRVRRHRAAAVAYRALDGALRDRPADPVGSGALARRGWTTVILRVVLPNIWSGHPVGGGIHLDRGGPRGVHHRVAEVRDDPGPDRGRPADGRTDLRRRVAGGAAVRSSSRWSCRW